MQRGEDSASSSTHELKQTKQERHQCSAAGGEHNSRAEDELKAPELLNDRK